MTLIQLVPRNRVLFWKANSPSANPEIPHILCT